MLVLTRKTNERVEIGDAVELVVLSIQGNRVRLGITAPIAMRIARGAPVLCCSEPGQSGELELELACGVG